MFIGPHKHFQAVLKRLQKNNIWRLNHQQTPPSTSTSTSSSLIRDIAYSVMKLTKKRLSRACLTKSTVNHSLCWRWWESCCIFRCRSSGRSFRGLPPEKENKPLIHFPTNGFQWASERPPGGCPASPAPRTRMFGLENDFPTPSAPFSNCPKGNYLVSFPLKKNQERQCYCIK